MALALNTKDPSGLRATEDRRAAELSKDLDNAAKRALERVMASNTDDPQTVQRIVDQELSMFDQTSKDKVLSWVNDTWGRSDVRAQKLIRMAGGKVNATGTFGGGAPYSVLRIAEVRVNNDIQSLSVDTKKVVVRAIVDGMAQGNGPRVIAKQISDDTGMVRRRAELIARTETMNTNRQASSETYARHGITEEEWLAADDDRVCEECNSLDGTTYPVGQRPHVHDGTDIQCRCIGIPVIPRVD